MEILAILGAMGAGVFGAAIGGLAAFVFVGVFILIGIAIIAAGGGDAYMTTWAFGAWGPHVAGFACGVAAAAWAGNKGKIDNGRDIVTPLMGLDSPTPLIIGAVFGLIGYLINWVLNLVGFAWTDTVGLTVVISGIIARLVWGKTGLFGKVQEGGKRWERNPDIAWVPWQCNPPQLTTIGLGAGLMSAYAALAIGPENGGVFFGFAFSAVSLILLQFGQKAPVTHHITLVAAVVAAASGSLIWGTVFGLVAAYVGEFFNRLWLCYGDTHIDPAASAIATLTSLSLILGGLGVYGALVLP